MRRLVLLRHAEAAAAASDLDRPLTTSGRDEARDVGSWLLTQGLVPDFAVVSPARRTRETWEQVQSALGSVPGGDMEMRVDTAVYAGSTDAVVELAVTADAGVGTLLIVGHNPSMEAVASWLAAATVGCPPGGACAFGWNGDWADLAPGHAKVLACHRARLWPT
jgi:phosphohistidine phosphatase